MVRHVHSRKSRSLFRTQRFDVSALPLIAPEQPLIYFRIRRGVLSAVQRNAFKRLVRQQLQPHRGLSSHWVFHVGGNHQVSSWETFMKGVEDDLEQFLQTQKSQPEPQREYSDPDRAVGT